ncbi:GntR family transcriptional regulator [Promicromonospora sp. NPDC050880]|uniref:GntR family transcriptional regulator n=1 Tax=Promicromonospora sp. NPDC050880 TaxID=3364406 RepID=UPI0037B3F178
MATTADAEPGSATADTAATDSAAATGHTETAEAKAGDLVERTAAAIRTWIITGTARPGERLSEKSVAETLAVSRNTLREAFRVLTYENLLVRRPHAGVMVAVPTLASILDIYRVRRMVEGQALRDALPGHPATAIMRDAVETAERARDAQDWRAAGTANMEFHRGIVALCDSEHLDRLYATVSAELRLAFGLLANPEYLHAPYVARNARILEMTLTGDSAAAAAELDDYLVQSERTVAAAYSRRTPPESA